MTANVEELVKNYIDLRETKKRMEAVLEEKLKTVTERMESIEIELLHFFNSTGQTSAKTKYGTPYTTTVRNVSVSDSNEFFKFVKDNDAFDLVQKRVVSTVFDQYIEDGAVIPGVNVESRVRVKIKKS